MTRNVLPFMILFSLIGIVFCSSAPIYDYNELDNEPEILYKASPEYPEKARNKGWEGTVITEAVVDVDGTVSNVDVISSSGYRILDNAAKDAAQQWVFTPGEKDGEPARFLVNITFNFSIRESG